ncbi:rho GTPase-activating protein gacO-like [Macrobrachium rosenbergii]|uniref:rho GTPase-activating protein gacO-like n=1 Tax=Macrobrachium rosenbergii TaxID=79674 RepID=UPI0034D453BA
MARNQRFKQSNRNSTILYSPKNLKHVSVTGKTMTPVSEHSKDINTSLVALSKDSPFKPKRKEKSGLDYNRAEVEREEEKEEEEEEEGKEKAGKENERKRETDCRERRGAKEREEKDTTQNSPRMTSAVEISSSEPIGQPPVQSAAGSGMSLWRGLLSRSL